MNYKNVIIFDGVCHLCSWVVRFVIRRDYKNKYLFAPIQSKIGEQLLLTQGFQPENIQTILLIKDGKPYTKSDAVFEIISDFRRGWKILLVLRFLPGGFRDFLYSVIARNRYKWFGKYDQCMIPSPEIKAKFLE